MSDGKNLAEKVAKTKGIEVIKSLAYDLKDQQENLYDRLISLKNRTIGATPMSDGEGKGCDVADNSLSIIEDVLRTALTYGSHCHGEVSELDKEL